MDHHQRQAYLEAMGITPWVRRDQQIVPDAPEVSPAADDVVAEHQPAQSPETSGAESSRSPAPESVPPMEDVPWLEDIPPCMEELSPIAGDFDNSEPEAPFRNEISGLGWDQLQHRVVQCQSCELHKTRTQTVFGVGNQTADLMIIGEAPGADEDRQGEPFVGRAGQLLTAMLKAIGLQREQVYIANILKCRPPGNRDPRQEEAAQCQPYLTRQIGLVQPKAVLAVGRIAAQHLLGSQDAVGMLRGRSHDYQGIPLVVTYHPAYLLRSPEQKGKSWQDLQKVARLL